MCGITLGIYVCGGITGAHLNPAVTIALAMFRGFPWKKVPTFIFAQTLGAFIAAACVYWNYKEAFNTFHTSHPNLGIVPSTGGVFCTYPAILPDGTIIGTWPSFVDEFLASVLLIFVIFAINDQNNLPPGSNMAPLMIGLLVLAIGLAFGIQTGYAINPARDFGPRLFSYAAGWGEEVWTYGNNYWWIPVVAPIVGAVVGGGLYDFFLLSHSPSEFE
eukprot:Sdes_comp20698_c0_seq1m16297